MACDCKACHPPIIEEGIPHLQNRFERQSSDVSGDLADANREVDSTPADHGDTKVPTVTPSHFAGKKTADIGADGSIIRPGVHPDDFDTPSKDYECPPCDTGIHGECHNINPSGNKPCTCGCYANQNDKVGAAGDDLDEEVPVGDVDDLFSVVAAAKKAVSWEDFQKYPIQEKYVVRFINPEQSGELVNLYHLAKVPLSGQKCGRYERMLWASKEFAKAHPEVSPTAAYKDLDGLLS
jgi:hypothetical protein